MSMPPPIGTIEYAVWAYQREMDKAEAERQRKLMGHVDHGA